jgi:hypothetical protein
MTQEELIEAVYETAWVTSGRVVPDYSGRHMYGKLCYGVVGNRDTIQNSAGHRGLPAGIVDDMGMDSIVYWPSIKGKSSEEEE